jgi:hypothetical protein
MFAERPQLKNMIREVRNPSGSKGCLRPSVQKNTWPYAMFVGVPQKIV